MKNDKYILLFLFFLFQSLKCCVNTVCQSNYTLSNYYDTCIYAHTEILSTTLLIILRTARYSHTFIFNLFSYQRLLVQNTTALESLTINVILQ